MLPPPAEKLQNFFGVFLQFQIGVDSSKFVVIGVVCCQEMRRYALFHKVLLGLAKYLFFKHGLDSVYMS